MTLYSLYSSLTTTFNRQLQKTLNDNPIRTGSVNSDVVMNALVESTGIVGRQFSSLLFQETGAHLPGL